MAVKATFTAQMIFLDTPERVGEIKAWATKSNRALSDLLREALFDSGWPRTRRALEDEYGHLSSAERHWGIHDALPPADREAYRKVHGLKLSVRPS